jgi:hypothetical protein
MGQRSGRAAVIRTGDAAVRSCFAENCSYKRIEYTDECGGGANASQGAGATAIQSGAQSQTQNQNAVIAQDQEQVPVQEANQNSGVAQSSGVGNDGSSGSANPPQQQTAEAVFQLQQLHASLAAAGQDAEGTFPGSQIPQAQGQFVNTSAQRPPFEPDRKVFIMNHTRKGQSVVSLPHRK